MSHSSYTLQEFQAGEGIPLGQQIVLIGNSGLFSDFEPVFYPWQKLRPFQFLRESITRRAIYGPSRYSIAKPLRSTRLFVGFFDGSFDRINEIYGLFDWIRNRPNRNFQLLIGKGDYVLDTKFVEALPENLTVVCGNNVNSIDQRLNYLPMGRDFRSAALFERFGPQAQKTTVCYCNFSVSTHPLRSEVYQAVKDKSFVRCEHMGQFLDYSISREDFFDQLSKSQFCICPRGNAFDTFRMWDCLYVGTVPIVVKEAAFHEQLEDLPILFLDCYDDFALLNEEFLQQTYQRMLSTRYNFDKLNASYWLESLT